MKVLLVIHGYPLRYNAGSEVYTQTLCHGLAEHQTNGSAFKTGAMNLGAFTPGVKRRNGTQAGLTKPRVTQMGARTRMNSSAIMGVVRRQANRLRSLSVAHGERSADWADRHSWEISG